MLTFAEIHEETGTAQCTTMTVSMMMMLLMVTSALHCMTSLVSNITCRLRIFFSVFDII